MYSDNPDESCLTDLTARSINFQMLAWSIINLNSNIYQIKMIDILKLNMSIKLG